MSTADVWECPPEQTIVGMSQVIMNDLIRYDSTPKRGFTASVLLWDPIAAARGRERSRLIPKLRHSRSTAMSAR